MGYFLRQDKKKKGIYLQMYETYWNSELKQPRTRSIQSFGYVEDLVSESVPDPVSYYRDYVKRKEEERRSSLDSGNRPRAFTECLEKNAGIFLIDCLFDELEVRETIDILASVCRFKFSIYDMIRQLVCARIIFPCSKSRTISSVFPTLFNASPMSEDQVYEGLRFIGESYKKYIELFNVQYERFYRRDYSSVFFDCTNYYFEIDLPREDLQKGPSKENRHEPIIGQALLLDSDLVPVAMQMYPGNESEKPYIRKLIEEMKQRYRVTGHTVQVADKGLNCARNIYAAVKESDDGYIFSKSIHGHGLSEKEKQWLTLENDTNKFTDYRDCNGRLRYRLKSCVDVFDYKFRETDTETGEETTTSFQVRERRVVSFNPALAAKQKAEIMKMAEKASDCVSYKKLAREELGDAAKYVKAETKDSKGRKVKPVFCIDQAKIDEDLKYAGYNLLVTSETEMTPLKIYETYHGLWKIEESFRITKSYLDARPVYVQSRESIYGHFLICYLGLFLLRVLEIKCFSNSVSSYDLINFIRDFKVVKKDTNTYINMSRNQKLNEKIKAATGLCNLDALFLSEKEIENLFRCSLLTGD